VRISKVTEAMRAGRNQGVGYLDNGLEVLVDRAAPLLGRTIDATVTGVFFSLSCNLIFAITLEEPAATKQ
jgi:uncharacterized protein YacL